MIKRAKKYHEQLIETLAEHNNEIMESYLNDEKISKEKIQRI